MSRKEWIVTLLIPMLAAGWKLLLLAWDVFPFNADEAVVGLMARHILAGERPIFFYGQAYMGSLDAYLVAGVFAALGESVLAIRLTQVFLYLGTIITTIFIARKVFGTMVSGWVAGVLLMVPTVNTTLYTTASLGGYGEALLIGNLILLIGLSIYQKNGISKWPITIEPLLLGMAMGVGLWANGLTLIYSLPVALMILVLVFTRGRQSVGRAALMLALILLGFFIGSLPWWIFAAQNGMLALLSELTGSAVAVETQSWLSITGQHALNLVLFGLTALLGLRPPWEVRWLVEPLIPPVLVFWIFCVGYGIRQTAKGDRCVPFRLLGGVALMLIAAFLFTPFGVDPSGRYFLPLSVLLSLAAGGLIASMKQVKWQIGVVGLILLFQGWGTLDCARINPPGITTQFNSISVVDTSYQAELISFLRENGATRGYSNYWVAYPLAFLSGEEVIYSPRLPYHANLDYTARDDRYPVYTKQVETADQIAYITTNHPTLNDVLRHEFTNRGISWREQEIGDYHVFYDLSRRISPDEMKIYRATQTR